MPKGANPLIRNGVKELKPITGAESVRHKLAVGIHPSLVVPEAVAMPAKLVTKPGIERWPVKTGTDANVTDVGEHEKSDGTLDYGFIDTTVEELISVPRPAAADGPASQDHRVEPMEATVWRLEADIIALKFETDGDFHLVLQGDSGHTMIGEVPTPGPPFVAASSPFENDISGARQAVYTKLVAHLSAQFANLGQTLAAPMPAARHRPAKPPVKSPNQPTQAFQTKITPTKARLIGVGFFDRLHGQMGVAPNGIELHPVLSVEWV